KECCGGRSEPPKPGPKARTREQMMTGQPAREPSRAVVERIFIGGRLELETPAHFGNGDAEGTTDMPLLYDAVEDGRPLLTGASVAGALRNYLRECEHGYGWTENRRAAS